MESVLVGREELLLVFTAVSDWAIEDGPPPCCVACT
jgi:hypothetical protein